MESVDYKEISSGATEGSRRRKGKDRGRENKRESEGDRKGSKEREGDGESRGDGEKRGLSVDPSKEEEVEGSVLPEDCSSPTAKLWNAVKKPFHLCDFGALPEYLRDNEFILRGYRSEWPLKHALLSIFRIHNETGNIWTHLIGFLLFFSLTIYTFAKLPIVVADLPTLPHWSKFSSLAGMELPTVATLQKAFPHLHLPESISSCFHHAANKTLAGERETEKCLFQTLSEDVMQIIRPLMQRSSTQKPVSRWPFFVFLSGAMICLFSSSVCHLLGCHSKEFNSLIWRFDYAGIAALIASSFYPPVYYGFLCDPLPRYIYLITITTLGLATLLVSLLDEFQQTSYRNFRAFLFFCMGSSGVIPTAHKLLFYWREPVVVQTTLMELLMGFFYALGAVFYASRIPERWLPGKFDIAGHSHQIFHVLVVAGAYTHYHTALLYLKWRDAEGCSGVA